MRAKRGLEFFITKEKEYLAKRKMKNGNQKTEVTNLTEIEDEIKRLLSSSNIPISNERIASILAQ